MSRNIRARLAETLLSPRFFWAAIAAALVLRVAWAVAAGDAQRFHDSDSYLKIADNLLAGRGFLWGDQLVGRPPLYPLLVAATRVDLFGREFLALYIVQAILSTATVLLFAASARRLLGPLAGGITALAVALDPFLVFYAGTVLSESLFTFFLAAFFYGVTLLLERPRMSGAIIAGAAAGGSFLTRPSLLYLVVAFAVMVALVARPRAKALAAAAAVLVLAALVTLPWAARNRRVTGHMVFATLGVGASLYDGVGPQADGSSDMNFLHAMPELEGMNEFERDTYLKDKALAAAKADPARVARLAVAKAARTWNPLPHSEAYGGALYLWVGALATTPLYAMALLAVLLGALSRRNLFIIALGPVYFTLLHAVFVGSPRYRAPVMPFVAMAAAACAAAFLARGLGAPQGRLARADNRSDG